MKSLLSWLKIAVYKFQEIFWPTLSKDQVHEEPQILEIKDLNISDDNLERAFDLKTKIHEKEVERRNTVESRATLFISTISVSASLVIAANALITNSNEINFATKISVFFSFVLSIYTAKTIWFSVKTISRVPFHVITFDEMNVMGTKEEYYRYLIIHLNNLTNQNHSIINKKVDYLIMAQEYYKRAIIVIGIYACFIFMFCVFFKNDRIPPKENHLKFFNIIHHDTIKY